MGMATFVSINKLRDKNDRIVGYELMDEYTTNTVKVEADKLKAHIKRGGVRVTNLTLTKDNRLVDRKMDTDVNVSRLTEKINHFYDAPNFEVAPDEDELYKDSWVDTADTVYLDFKETWDLSEYEDWLMEGYLEDVNYDENEEADFKNFTELGYDTERLGFGLIDVFYYNNEELVDAVKDKFKPVLDKLGLDDYVVPILISMQIIRVLKDQGITDVEDYKEKLGEIEFRQIMILNKKALIRIVNPTDENKNNYVKENLTKLRILFIRIGEEYLRRQD